MKKRKRRFSLAPLYAALAVGIGQAVALNLTPLIADVKGPRTLAPGAVSAYRLAAQLDRQGFSPLVLGVGIAVVGIVSVLILPSLRFLWWLAAVGACLGLALLMVLFLQPLYTP
jgi:hypothetical protein